MTRRGPVTFGGLPHQKLSMAIYGQAGIELRYGSWYRFFPFCCEQKWCSFPAQDPVFDTFFSSSDIPQPISATQRLRLELRH